MDAIKTEHLRNAIEFLQRVFVGSADEQRLVETITALQQEVKRKEHDERNRKHRT
jgi:hypothetical protein